MTRWIFDRYKEWKAGQINKNTFAISKDNSNDWYLIFFKYVTFNSILWAPFNNNKLQTNKNISYIEKCIQQ